MTKPSRRYSGLLVTAQLRAELDRLLHEIVAASETASRSGWTPPLDVLDLGPSLLILLEVPGTRAADLHVDVEGNTLRISGRRRLTFPSGSRIRFHCLERQEGAFERRLDIGTAVDFGKAKVQLAQGILRIEIPKIEDRRRRPTHLAIEELPEDDTVADRQPEPPTEVPPGQR